MSRIVELTVPDIGNFKDVPVIEVLVKPGETVAVDAPLVMLESEKATMEVPASTGGVVHDVKVRVGDKVSQGTIVATVELADEASAAAAAPAPAVSPAPPPAPAVNGSPNGAANGAGRAAPSPVDRATVVEVAVPDIGNFKDVPVIEVLVKPGDDILVDTPLVLLESEKATMEVPATTSGVVRDVKVRVGDKVSAGTPIVTLDVSPVVTDGGVTSNDVMPAGAAMAAAQAAGAAAAPAAPSTPPAAAPPPASTGGANTHASPAIRRFARELGVDLGRVSGTGPNGRVTRDDVQGFIKRALTDGPAPAANGAPAGGLKLLPWPAVDFAQFGTVERKPLTRIAKLSGPNLARNWVMIPHVTQHDDADVTDLEAFRKQLNAENKDAKVTMLAFLLKASVAALRRFPDFNASLAGEEIVLKQYYHLGFAADTPGGLVVPVIRDVDKKGIVQIAQETAALAGKARDGKLSLSDMQGSTFTISSLGGIGGTYFTPIINAPEVAILGAARAAVRPVWDGSAFVPRSILPLSLSYDHRVIDGAKAARFTTYLASVLADLRRTLL